MEFATLERPTGALPSALTAATLAELCARLLRGETRLVSARETRQDACESVFMLGCADGRRLMLRVSAESGEPGLASGEARLLRREAALQPAMEAVLGPLVPPLLGVDFSGEIVPGDVVLGACADGERWDPDGGAFAAGEDEAVWRELGGIVRRIHGVRGARFGWPDEGPVGAPWSDFVLREARGLVLEFGRCGAADGEPRRWLGALEDGRALLDEVREPRLVHGGVGPGGVFVRREGAMVRVAAIAGHCRGWWGDPASEGLFHRCACPSAFFETYGPRPDGAGALFRAHAYRGRVLAQGILGTERHGAQAAQARAELECLVQDMRRLIVACGLS
jgi:hypothetical protein